MAQKAGKGGGPLRKKLDKIPKMVTIGKIEKISSTFNYIILSHPKDAPLRYGETLVVGKGGDTGLLTVYKVYRKYTVANIAKHPKQAIAIGTPVMAKAKKATPKPSSKPNDLRADDWKDKALKEIDNMEIIYRRNLVRRSTKSTKQAAKLLVGKKKDYPEAIDKMLNAEKWLKSANGHHPTLTELRKTLGNTLLEYARQQFDQAKIQTWDTLEKAKSDAIKTLQYDPALKPQVQLLTNAIIEQMGTMPKPKVGRLLRKKLDTIVITQIRFVDTRVSTVFEFLKKRSRGLDPAKVGVNFLLTLPKGKEEPTITMDFYNVPLRWAVKHVCKQAGLTYQVAEKAIFIGDFKPVEETKSKSEQNSPADAGQ
jgi:hypothetical protein